MRPLKAWGALKWCHRRSQAIWDLLKSSGEVERLRDELKKCVRQYLQLLPDKGRPPPPDEQIKTAPLIRRLYANAAKSAVYHGREECLEWALDHGARLNTLTRNRNTLLHLAAHTGNPSICYMLLQRGAANDRLNHFKELPWQVAMANGSATCEQLLRAWYWL